MTPVLGSAYQATCRLTVDSDVNLDETIGALVIQWLGPDGEFFIHGGYILYTSLESLCGNVMIF